MLDSAVGQLPPMAGNTPRDQTNMLMGVDPMSPDRGAAVKARSLYHDIPQSLANMPVGQVNHIAGAVTTELMKYEQLPGASKAAPFIRKRIQNAQAKLISAAQNGNAEDIATLVADMQGAIQEAQIIARASPRP